MSKNDNNYSDSNGSNLLDLFVGIILLVAGLFMISKRVIVHSGWYRWSFGGFDFSSGTVTIPLIISIIWYFAKPKSIIAKFLMVASAVILIISVIMSVRINFMTTTMFDYVLMFGMAAAGTGLILRNRFDK